MCLDPTRLPSNPTQRRGGEYVACRKCWQCRERKVDDWVGRNIAESLTARSACTVSLTYGRDRSAGGIDHMRAAVLTYSDVQKMLKHLRVDGWPVRYFAVGEYGSEKSRAHWHIILYWQGEAPAYEVETDRYMWKYWPHGFAYFRDIREGKAAAAVRYACKYLLKDQGDDEAQAVGPIPSRFPPLGDSYFRDLAERHVADGLAPQDLFYTFPGVVRVPYHTPFQGVAEMRKAAKPIKFHMNGKTAENFCRHFVDTWEATYPDRVVPRSRMLLEKHVDWQTTAQPAWGPMPDYWSTPVWGKDEDGWHWVRKTRKAPKMYVEYEANEGEWVAYYGTEKPDWKSDASPEERAQGRARYIGRWHPPVSEPAGIQAPFPPGPTSSENQPAD